MWKGSTRKDSYEIIRADFVHNYQTSNKSLFGFSLDRWNIYKKNKKKATIQFKLFISTFVIHNFNESKRI